MFRTFQPHGIDKRTEKPAAHGIRVDGIRGDGIHGDIVTGTNPGRMFTHHVPADGGGNKGEPG